MNRFKRTSTRLIHYKRKTNSFLDKIFEKRSFKAILTYTLLGFGVFIILATTVIYVKYIRTLPDIKDLENLNFAKSSIIYDRDGNELYKLYKENRTYVGYDNISKNMINALVAGEDKRFWENPGIDIIGLFRAFIYGIIGKNEGFGGTSTLTQQLIRNTIIENRSSTESISNKLERKIKEIYLAYKLTNGVSKEKILELYLNKIDFGSNSYGIEQASKTFFGKSAKDIGVLEASILASIPKGPSYYSPYSHPDRLLGYIYTYDKDNEKEQTKIITEKDSLNNANDVNLFLKYIESLKSKKISDATSVICGINKENHKSTITIDKDGCSLIDYSKLLEFLNSIQIKNNGKVIEYQTGRKDFILQRMLEDGYIEFDDYKNSITSSIGFKFQKNIEKIKAAHFIMYVREYLEKKYGKEFVDSGGLKIYTTIDSKLQAKAEELIEKQGATNAKRFDANNDALISIDNTTGEILTMVGGRDYFDEENGGNVNMITSKLQPGSSFKPFVYAQAIDSNEIGSKTPVFDLQTNFPGGYTPSNFDGKFMGLMNISTALDNSRNIPAIKMVYIGGGEEKVVELTKKLGFENIYDDGRYGASIGLGTVEVTPLEMAKAYTVFANLGKKKEITPILKILDSKGVVIEEKKSVKDEEVLDPATAYIINSILSDTSSRPAGWNTFVSLSDRKVAAKTGTSTKQYEKNGKKIKLPRNLWTIGYTPQITTVVRVGNTDGKEVNMSGDGLNAAGPIWRDFMTYAHKDKPALTWKRPEGVSEISISKLTGFPAEEGFRSDLVTTSLFKNPPTGVGSGLKTVKVDALCNGKVSELTPTAGIKNIYVLDIHSLLPENPAWETPVQNWIKEGGYKETLGELVDSSDIIKDTICDREENPTIGNIQIASKVNIGDSLLTGSNYIELAYRSNTPIIKIDILLDEIKIDEISLPGKKEGSYRGNIKIPETYSGKYNLVLRAVDNNYYSADEVKEIEVLNKDKIPPKITIENPIDKSIKLYKGQTFNLRGQIDEISNLKSINIYIDGKPLKIGLTDREFVYPITAEGLEVGNHTIKVEAVDNSFNTSNEEINLEIIE